MSSHSDRYRDGALDMGTCYMSNLRNGNVLMACPHGMSPFLAMSLNFEYLSISRNKHVPVPNLRVKDPDPGPIPKHSGGDFYFPPQKEKKPVICKNK